MTERHRSQSALSHRCTQTATHVHEEDSRPRLPSKGGPAYCNGPHTLGGSGPQLFGLHAAASCSGEKTCGTWAGHWLCIRFPRPKESHCLLPSQSVLRALFSSQLLSVLLCTLLLGLTAIVNRPDAVRPCLSACSADTHSGRDCVPRHACRRVASIANIGWSLVFFFFFKRSHGTASSWDVLSLRSWHESPDPGGVHGPYGSIDISKIERRCLPSFPNANEAQLCHQSQHHAINLSSSQRETRCGLTQLSASGIHTGRPFISGRAFCFNQPNDVLFQGTAVTVSFQPTRTRWVLSGRDATPKTKFNLAAHSGPRNVRETQLRRPGRASSFSDV